MKAFAGFREQPGALTKGDGSLTGLRLSDANGTSGCSLKLAGLALPTLPERALKALSGVRGGTPRLCFCFCPTVTGACNTR